MHATEGHPIWLGRHHASHHPNQHPPDEAEHLPAERHRHGEAALRRLHQAEVHSVGPTPTDEGSIELRQRVIEALTGCGDRLSGHLEVAVDNGAVTLTGSVGSWPEWDLVYDTVRAIPGVRFVEDELRISRAPNR